MRSPAWERAFPMRRRSRETLFIMAVMLRFISETAGLYMPARSGRALKRSQRPTGALLPFGESYKGMPLSIGESYKGAPLPFGENGAPG